MTDTSGKVRAMLMLVGCPECGATAEITGSFRLPSTDGPVDHVAVSCIAGHHFRMPAGELTDARYRVEKERQIAQRYD